MKRIQVVYASRHGGTAGIAERIAGVLRSEGADVVIADAADRPEAIGFDGHVVGSGVQIGSWFKEATEFLERNQSTLAAGPVWLFSSGPLQGSSKMTEGTDLLTLALGPEEGPGSGGRKRISELSAAIHPRGHGVFYGAFDPKDSPKTMVERVVRLMPASKRILPTGDFRDWDAIDAWAREIAAELLATVPVG
ncbi:MAG TPA: flavodoxin domain-containing protein [Verrucomicrobiae bacterium]|jgi:menaquinone-dependent protoporphyrinogen oxidase|nr:flavodoxin domain-containing protein [Verrucomicrobiae bacterium]